MGILYTVYGAYAAGVKMPIDAYNNYGERFCQVFKWSFSWGGTFFEPDIAWYNVLLNKNRLTKMADLGIIFLRRKHTIHWYQSLFTVITGSMPFRYFWATLYIRAPAKMPFVEF